MANKKTVVELYKEILANPTLTEEQKTFIEKRIEITEKKNASGKGADPTPKQKEQMALNAEIETAILGVMEQTVKYTTAELVKLLGRSDVASTQKLTPRLTALCECGKVVKSTEKGRSIYTLA